jgi:hypothetical protein
MYLLENEYLLAAFDDKARLVRLENKALGCNTINRPAADSFRLVAKIGENWENVIFAREQAFAISLDGQELTAIVNHPVSRYQACDLKITLKVRLIEDTLIFDSTLENQADDLLVTDWTWPVIGCISSLAGGSPDLLWPNHLGERYTNVTALSGDLHLTYPGGHGRGASMQWMALIEENQTLALSGRDKAIYSSELSVRKVPARESDQADSVSLEMTRLPFARPGEAWVCPPCHLTLYSGSWHRAADQYRAWATTWRRTPAPPEWVKAMSGYFLVINKQQYGEAFWPYDTLPELYRYALENGCDTVGLFGWYDGGHDNTYPELVTSPALGGDDGMRAGIRKVRDQGGHVTLYFQGHLLDLTTDYYKTTGHKIESKSRWLTPYYQTHCKSHNSRFLANYTSKFFSSACPSCPEWQDEMAQNAERLAGLGPNGLLYDQIGGMHPYPCFDESHPHEQNRPSLAFVPGRVKVLDRIQQATKKIDPELAFFTEHITDVYSGYADILHGMYVNPDAPGSRSSEQAGEDRNLNRSRLLNYPELFRYTFPDTIATIRNGKPFISQRYLNYAFLFGLRLEMELRYLDDQDAIRSDRHPEERQQAANLTAFRKRHWNLLGSGRFTDTLPVETDNPNVLFKAFTDGNQVGVALWNDASAAQTVTVRVPGFIWLKTDKPDQRPEASGETNASVCLQPQDIAIMVFNAEPKA